MDAAEADSDHRSAAAANSANSEREICCSMTSVLLRLVRKSGGEAAVARLLANAGSSREVAYLESVDNWVSLQEASRLLQAGVEETGDAAFARRVGEHTLRQHAGTQVATVLRSLGSMEAVLTAVAASAARLSGVTDMEALEVAPGRGVVTARARAGYTRDRLHCDWAKGLLSGQPLLFGMPLARVEESECQARGDERCLYTITWDAEAAAAAADPQQRVTALEAQLLAMSERLQSSYSTARDLVSTDDLDTVLHRIVERAAHAARAPSHILAVRTDPDAEAQIYCHGIDEQRARELAGASSEGEDTPGESLLVADVTSPHRHYGQLIARYPGAVDFFDQDGALLGMYAQHAAAVLDTSMALRESARRHSQVSSLLSLAQALAQAGTTSEVAERLAGAIPRVVDCDRVGVWLWDELERNLKAVASTARTPEEAERLRGLTISASETPSLQEMLSEPHPQFFEAGTEDRLVGELMAALGVVALTVVPIVARDDFLGVLTVSVTDDARRLRSDSELVERLAGVAALSAPAIQNGQLVDKLEHQANHDELTGLLNRAGFRRHIERVLADGDRGETGQVGLLFVDLDGFKRVNDVYGHDVGDELLRSVARRLEATARNDDVVTRLGGDEFAVILANVVEESEVRAAERRVREAFAEPFVLADVPTRVSASVGGGMWPGDGATIAELVRHADAAMYEEKARGRSSETLV